MKLSKALKFAAALVAGGILLGGCTVRNPLTGELVNAPEPAAFKTTQTPTPTPTPAAQSTDTQLSQLDQDFKQLDNMNKDINDGVNDTPIDLNNF